MAQFMRILNLLSGPLVGLVIGIFTNYIAVKMLFRPRHEIRVFGVRLPLTPGIIPSRQKALSRAVGKAVGESLVREEDICRVFLSDEILGVITQKALDLPTLGVIGNEVFLDDYPAKREKVILFLEEKILAGIKELDPASLVVNEGAAAIKNYASGNPLLRMFVSDSLIASVTAPLGEKVNEYLDTTGREMLHRKLSEEAEVLEAKTPSALVGGDEVLTMLVKNAYASFFGAFAADLAAHFHISEIVEEKMNAMPPEDLEELVLSVMKKELNIVIWLGGVIGFVLGIINTLISFF